MNRISHRHGDQAHRECIGDHVKRHTEGRHQAEGRPHCAEHHQIGQDRAAQSEEADEQHDRDHHGGQRIQLLRVCINIGRQIPCNCPFTSDVHSVMRTERRLASYVEYFVVGYVGFELIKQLRNDQRGRMVTRYAITLV